MSTARRLLAGASWVYSAQLLTVLAQFAYAAVTSRAVGPAGFGAYAVALAVTGLVSLLAMGGLGQTISRMDVIEPTRVRPLVTYAVLLGGGCGLILLFTAPFWGWLWGVESASDPIRWLAISSSLSPLLGLATGLMARTGKFRSLALITLSSNILGMVTGALAVIHWHTASSLVVSTAVAQTLTLVGAIISSERGLLGLSAIRKGHADIGYSRRLTSTNMLSYLTGNIVKFSMTRGIDTASLGHWNRAEALTSIPMQQIQSALIRAVYPEFRHDIEDSARAKVVWTDMLVLVAGASMTLSAVALVLVPPVIPWLFGSNWETAAALAGPLAIAGGLQILSTLLASAVEALGRFRWIVSTEVILIGVQVISAVLVLVTHTLFIAVIALILTNVVRHGWHIFLLGRRGYLDIPRLLKNYIMALGLSTFIGLGLWCSVQLVKMGGSSIMYIVLAVLAMLLPIGLFLALRRRLSIVIIARKYGIFRG
ncbi:oligosaccharide flippase family protein [Pseudarthrobacter sp. CC12]|uniref:oligosaccharide flippase family protein n=1 Tax=Pseudarthrobacter sp. CC12 TaxID=3029193 RepID=UPI0032630F0A